jgi:hypothetical protein
MSLFCVIFEDGDSFSGGDLEHTKWEEIPDKEIRSLFYATPFGDTLVLSGYSSYYHYVEATMDLNGEKQGQKLIDCIKVMGMKDNKVKIWTFNLSSVNPVSVEIRDIADEFIQKLNPIFWKKGV